MLNLPLAVAIAAAGGVLGSRDQARPLRVWHTCDARNKANIDLSPNQKPSVSSCWAIRNSKAPFIIIGSMSTMHYTYTLTTRLADILMKAEEKYGPREQEWTILGVEFGPGEVPQIWYPFSSKFVAAQLTCDALEDQFLATWQLAHEAVHFLAPTGGTRVNVIEEGAATVFQQDYGSSQFGRLGAIKDARYQRAEMLVRELLEVGPNVIKRLRVVEPYFVKMTPATFSTAQIELRPGLVSDLLAPF